MLSCLLPLPESAAESKRTIRKHFHSTAYPTSDIDLFLWGLTPAQAEEKINYIYESVRDSVPWDVTCVRTKHAVTIHSQYPYRSIQIVLRLYQSPAEVLAGFDIDAACVAYDGSRVVANPRAIVAMMRQCNTVDMTRRSPSYEIRLAKYAARGFEVSVPDLRRAEVDPTIFERSLTGIEGLARLLVLEKLANPQARTSYLNARRALRGRPSNEQRTRRQIRRQRKYKNDLKAGDDIGGLEMNDYDVASLHIPYGPGWNARRIAKLIYTTDLGLNSTYNPKNKGRRLHRHPAFFGSMKQCLEDCCEYCPEPTNDEEREMQVAQDKDLLRGRIFFIQDNPGRQSITGSFNPIDVGEWSAQAHIGVTQAFFAAIAALDRSTVRTLLGNGIDVSRRDHVGRTPLHVAIMVKATEICADLIEAGARMSARLVDGRTCLHLAAQLDLPEVVQKLLERSFANAEAAKAKAKELERTAQSSVDKGIGADMDDVERPSSEDDWDSEDSEAGNIKEGVETAKPSAADQPAADSATIPDDNTELPDVLDVNAFDWDLLFTPLSHAIVAGSVRSVDLLLNNGADAQLAATTPDWKANVLHPLANTALTVDNNKAKAIVQRLLQAGAVSSRADNNLLSIFHTLVCANKTQLVHAVLQGDPKAKTVLNVPSLMHNRIIIPLVTAIANGNYSLVVLLLAYGANAAFTQKDWDSFVSIIPIHHQIQHFIRYKTHYLELVYLPAETALAAKNDLIYLLADVGAQISVPCMLAWQSGKYQVEVRISLYDYIKDTCVEISKKPATSPPLKAVVPSGRSGTWIAYRTKLLIELNAFRLANPDSFRSMMLSSKHTVGSLQQASTHTSAEEEALAKAYYSDVESFLQEQKAKSWDELDPDFTSALSDSPSRPPIPRYRPLDAGRFMTFQGTLGSSNVPISMDSHYEALFEACWNGDIAYIQESCLPSKMSKQSSKQPLQITVQMTSSNMSRYANAHDGVYNPFSVAILSRRWHVAKAILAIATAQYKKQDDEPSRIDTTGIVLDESDSGSDDDGRDATDDDEDLSTEIEFTDLANRPSELHTDVSPSRFFTAINSARMSRDSTKEIKLGSLLSQAAQDSDQEAFLHILDLMRNLPGPMEPEPSILMAIIDGDCPGILDDYIRLTGAGITVDSDAVVEEVDGQVHHESEVYLGLNVNGKKRKDLAERLNKDKNVGSKTGKTAPLLWQAAYHGSKNIIEYLCGPGPQAAFQHYALSGSGECPQILRRLKDIDSFVKNYVGIQPNLSNETAMTAAMFTHKKDTALSTTKLMLSLVPVQAQTFLHSRLRLLNLPLMLLAVANKQKPELLDFLLANGVSADVQDYRGWNVYHYVCMNTDAELIHYFLNKLPQDLTARLLLQTSAQYINTPIMLAVKQGKIGIARLLLETGLESVTASLLKRDITGSLPLHVAVHQGRIGLVALLISVGSPDTLHMENGVGETPLETAVFQRLVDSTRGTFYGSLPVIPQLQLGNRGLGGWGVLTGLHGMQTLSANGQRGSDVLAEEIRSLRRLTVDLEEDGRFVANVKLKVALQQFVERLDRKRWIRSAETQSLLPESNTPVAIAVVDRGKTFEVVVNAVVAHPGLRRLIHISDVQKSVTSSLNKSSPAIHTRCNVTSRSRTNDGLDDEEATSAKQEWQKSIMGYPIFSQARGFHGFVDLA